MLLACEIFLSLVSVALAPGLIFLGSNSPLLTRRIDLRAGDAFSTSVAVKELFRVAPVAASICTADLDFMECLLALVWCSDDSAARLGLAPCGGVLWVVVLILFALPLALSPPRPSRLLLLPTPTEEADLDFIESLPLDDDEGGPGGGFFADVAPAVDGRTAMMFLGLFCPVLLVVATEVGAVDGLASLLMRCEGIVGSEGNLDIKGGLGGRAEVNL